MPDEAPIYIAVRDLKAVADMLDVAPSHHLIECRGDIIEAMVTLLSALRRARA